jgi:hypothetical protein
MTRSYGSSRSRRITQPLRIVKPPKHPAIEDLGFTCFRLVMGQPIVVTRSTNTMFAFVRAR